MCGGVRGVSAGGVVSSAFCLLFKLHTIRLTKKQVSGPDFEFFFFKMNISLFLLRRDTDGFGREC